MNQRYREPQPQVNERQNQRDSSPESQDIRVNGLEQVVEMLRHADPQFRASILRRLQARDPALAQRILRVIC
ncbi:MAG: hypothetical protein EBX52_01040 [Proteobacteria bacterium]|nr:hypothetical protein [Pseudomonadota bacterium]